MDDDKAPPSYNETFPTQTTPATNLYPIRNTNYDNHNRTSTTADLPLLEEVENVLKFASNFDIITIPGMNKELCKIMYIK
jgi:hypothetical protein